MNLIAESKEVTLGKYGKGKILGIYKGNKFPYHILFDDGSCLTFSEQEFNDLVESATQVRL